VGWEEKVGYRGTVDVLVASKELEATVVAMEGLVEAGEVAVRVAGRGEATREEGGLAAERMGTVAKLGAVVAAEAVEALVKGGMLEVAGIEERGSMVVRSEAMEADWEVEDSWEGLAAETGVVP